MLELRVVDGGKGRQAQSTAESVEICDQLDDPQFGMPQSLVVGLLTGLVGAAAGVISLLVYFFVWEPHYYISPQWTVFVLLGGAIGFFLRLERPIIREIYKSNGAIEMRRQKQEEPVRLEASILKARQLDSSTVGQ